jgi:superfamily II DNA or RNA helicase
MIPALRPYQSGIVQGIREASKDYRRVLGVAPTGSGKTVIFSHIAFKAAQRRNRVFVLVHRKEILIQTIRKLAMFGLQPGVIQSGQRMTANYIQVAMVQTLHNRVKYLGAARPDIIITDESHHAPASTYRKIIDAFPKALSLGFTATPARTDGKGLDDMYDVIVEGPQTRELVDAGYLSRPVVLSSPLAAQIQRIPGKIKKGEYDADSETVIMGEKTIVNETVDMYSQYFKGSPVVIFCASIADCESVATSMRSAGWKCETVRGDMPDSERQEYIDGLGKGQLNAVCSYEVLGEGVDVPILAGVIMRRRTMSVIVYLQQIGRALRIAPGKTHALIIDQVGNTFFHGHPLSHRAWSLKGIEKDEEKTPAVVQCPRCGTILDGRPRRCPYCEADLTVQGAEKEYKFDKTIHTQLEIIHPPDVGEGAIEAAELYAFSNGDRERELVERTLEDMRNGNFSMADRFGMIMKYLGKSRTYTNEVYKKYILPEMEGKTCSR